MNRETLRRFGALFTGTAAAQLLPVATAPVIARNYDTSEFGIFGLFVAASAIITTFANLKFDTAILALRSQREVRAILGLGVLINIFLGALIAIAMSVAINSAPLARFNPPHVFGALLSLSFILAGALQALSTAAFRNELFTAVARSRIITAATTAGLSMFAALAHPTATALIFASLSGQFAGLASLLATRKLRHESALDFRAGRLRAVVRKYWRFALFTSPADLLNALASNLPALLLGALYGNAATGAYVLAQRIVGTPLMLIGSAFSDLYRQKVGQRAASRQPYWDVTVRMMPPLAVIGSAALVSVLVFGPAGSRIFLGNQWSLVGEILQIMIFVYVIRFIVSPLTYTYYLARRHSEDLLLQCFSALSVLILYELTHAKGWSLHWYLALIATSLSVTYLIYGVRSLMLARASAVATPATNPQ